MSASANSPNALWAAHGYTIERQQRRTGGPKIRTVRNSQGGAVLHDAGYDAEMAWIRQHLGPNNTALPIIGPSRARYIITGDTHGTNTRKS